MTRRQAVTAVFLVVGAIVLAVSLRIEPGSGWFYPATFGLAAVWTVGAFASGPLHLGRVAVRGTSRRPVVTPVLVGALLAGVFVAGALVVHHLAVLEPLEERVRSVVDYADQGSLLVLVAVTLVNGVAEELFFRGAVYAAVPRRPVLWTTVAYGATTAATGNPMLTFAAVLLGLVVGLERRVSGGILAPILTHCTWALAMLLVLPLVF